MNPPREIKQNGNGQAAALAAGGQILDPGKLAMMLNAIPSAVVYIGSDGRVKFTNRAFDEIPGAKKQDPHTMEILGPDTPGTVTSQVELALSGTPAHFGFSLADDRIRYYEASFIPEKDDRGLVTGVVGMINDVTAQKQATDEHTRKQMELQDYVDHATVCIHYCDAHGNIIWANKAELELLGYEAEEYIGRHFSDFLVNGSDREVIDGHLLDGNELHQTEMVLKHRDGSHLTVLVNAGVLWEDGAFVMTRFFTTDITAHKQIENKLLEAESRYRILLENVPAAIYTCDAQGMISVFNQAAVELWGRKPEIGKDMWCGSWRIFEPDGITPLALDSCPMAMTLKEGRPIKGKEFVIQRPDGEKRSVQPFPVPLFDKNGKLTGAVNMLLDITERKEAESKLGHLAAIVHSSADPIISKTLEGIITSWNDAAERVFGYIESEMIGQPITKLIPDDRLDEEPRILDRLKKGEMVDHFETKRLTKDRRLVDISLSISPIRDSRGRIIGASKIARDITEQKAMHDALMESEERLRMASEATGLGTWEFYPLTKKLVWSDGCKLVYGVPMDAEVDLDTVAASMHPEDRVTIDKQIADAMKPENSDFFHAEYRISRISDRQQRWIKVRGSVYFNVHDQPERIIGTMLDVTEEKQLEQLIHEGEERLRMAIESTNLGTWEFLPIAGTLTWSDQCRKIYGIQPDIQIDFELFRSLTYPEDLAQVENAISVAMDPAGSGHYDVQFRIVRQSDQQVRWVRSQGKVYFNLSGKAERFIGTVLDIHEEKTQEQELRNSVELFTTMADNVPAMIWMSGDDKFKDFFNRTWLDFTGRTIEQESNEGWLENVHPDDVQRCIDNYNRSFRDQEGFYTEYRLRRNDGLYRWVADSSVPRYNPDGSFAGFISACMDIDDQKNYREKIQQSELRLKTISNAAPVGLWMTDKDAQNTFVNETWVRWTGVPFKDQLGVGWLCRVLEEDRDQATTKFRECLASSEPYIAEFRILRADNEIRWCLTEGAPYYDIEGKFAGYAGCVTDITEIKRTEERKDDFIKMASHELKTPITSIKGYVQLLLNIYEEMNDQKFLSSRSTVQSSLQTIGKQVSKLTRLVSELLDLSRIESGKLELNKIEFDLADLVEETVQDIRHTTTSHAIIFQNEFEGFIYADKDRLSQVLVNLLTNAIKYSPAAERVEVTLEKENTHAVITVRDFGIGIDKKDHERIFERFYRVEGRSEQTYPGFGIGLFIASEIVERHGGQIMVNSMKNKGSEFIVKLPLTWKHTR